MIRAVIDTNILIRSILNPKGPTGRILEELRAGRFRLLYSEALLEELAGVLARPRFRNKYRVSADDVSDILSLRGCFGSAAARLHAPKGHRHKAWGFNPRKGHQNIPSPEGTQA